MRTTNAMSLPVLAAGAVSCSLGRRGLVWCRQIPGCISLRQVEVVVAHNCLLAHQAAARRGWRGVLGHGRFGIMLQPFVDLGALRLGKLPRLVQLARAVLDRHAQPTVA